MPPHSCSERRYPHHAYREETISSGGLPIVLSVWERHPAACTVLFYPSTMASPLLHRFFLEELWGMGLNVVGLHPLGHGKSSTKNKKFTFQDILRNGLDAVDWITRTMRGPVVIAGHSQGGILALAHVAQDARPAAAFPLCTLLPQHPKAGTVTRFRRLLRHKERLLAVLRTGSRVFPLLPIFMPCYLELGRITAGAAKPRTDLREMRGHYPLCFVYSLFSADLSAACVDGNISCPVVLMQADNDALFTLPVARDMFACIRAPEKRLALIHGGGHMAPLCSPFATEIAARIAAHCAGYGLPLHACGDTTTGQDSHEL